MAARVGLFLALALLMVLSVSMANATTTISLTFNDLPCNGTIVANGITEINGNTVIFNQYVSNMPVNAIVPAGFSFSGWNATSGLSIANTLSQNTLLTTSQNGVLTAVSLPKPVIVVPGAANQKIISQGTGLELSPQNHNVVWVKGYYYYFYVDANDLIAYANSTDGIVWHQVGEIEKIPVNTSRAVTPLDAFTDGNTIYVVYHEQIANTTVITGTPSNGIIKFGSPTVLDTLIYWEGFSGTAVSNGVAAVALFGYNGSAGAYIEPVFETQNSGATWTELTTFEGSNYSLSPYGVQLVPLPNTANGLVFFTQYYNNTAFNYSIYNGATWTPLQPIGTKTTDFDDNYFAAFTAGNIVYFASPMPASPDPAYVYAYNAVSGTWSSGTKVSPANVIAVRLGSLSNKELILLYFNSTNQLYYRIMPFSTGTWSTPFFVTQNSINYGTLQYGTAYGVIGVSFSNVSNTLFFSKIPIAGPMPVITFDDSPSSGNIIVNGVQEANGNVVNACEGGCIFTINALAPSGYRFAQWQVSNATNLSIANTLSANTVLTVYGSGVVTATAPVLSKFVETGLPSGTKWNVTYDSILNSSTTNTILFSTAPGNYLFNVPAQTVNGIAYEPSPSSGYLVANNITTITFTLLNLPLTFNDLPCNGTIVANGATEINGNTVVFHQYISNMPVNAIVPAGFTFSGWNATSGLSIANTLSQNTLLTTSQNGVLTAVSLPKPVIVVPGAANVELIGLQGIGSGPQVHNIVLVKGYYYYFYIDANDLVAYANSTNGTVWHQVGEIEKIPVNQSEEVTPLDAFTDGNTIYVVYPEQIKNETVIAGTPSNGIITFGSPTVLDTFSYASNDWAGFSGTAVSNGVAGVALFGESSSTFIEPVFETQNSGATWTELKTFESAVDTGDSPYGVQLVPLPNTANGLVFFTMYYAGSAFNYSVYNGIAWTSPQTIGTKTADADVAYFAAFTAGNTVYFASPMPKSPDPAYVYAYNAVSGTWSSGTEVSPASVTTVRLGSLSNKELILLYYNSTNQLYYRIMPFSTGTWSKPFFVTQNTINEATLQYGTAYGVMGVSFSNATNTLFFSKIPIAGSIPVVTTAVPPTVPHSSSWVWITVVVIVIGIILVLLSYKLSHRKLQTTA